MNKVKFGLKNAHYAPVTVAEDGTTGYGTPVPIPGSVNLTLSAKGETSPFYADDTIYFTTVSNNGYEGDLEVALLPESFRTEILREKQDAKKVLFESASVETAPFALLFEFSGDEKATRHILYYCKATRPSLEGATATNTREPKTDTLHLVATPGPDGYVKASTGDQTDETVCKNWYKAVYAFAEVQGA